MKEAKVQGFRTQSAKRMVHGGKELNHGTRVNSIFDIRYSIFGSKGFTLIELIIVIILAGILVAAVAVRISLSPSQIASVTAVDQAVADIQYVQMLALGNRSNRSIVFNSGNAFYNILDSNGTTILETKKLPDGMPAGTTVTFTFNSLGELCDPGGCVDKSLSLGGSTITVYRMTGKVVVT